MESDKPQSAARRSLGDFAPKLVDLADDLLLGDVWERPQLSKRDRTHLAFSVGWPSAMSAVNRAKALFAEK